MDEVSNRTECVYVQNDHIFKCKGPLGEVECDAEWTMDESVKIEMFGIGKPIVFPNISQLKFSILTKHFS